MEEGIQGFILVHFGNVYASNRPLPDAIAKGIEHLQASVDSSTTEELPQPYTALEVKQTLFQMAPLKSPEPDGRRISDNILLAFELNHFLNSKTQGFPPPFICLVMLCVSTVSYSFMLCGEQFGSLVPERGLHQGDPLSPYLLLLCTESFSAILQNAEREGRIRGYSRGVGDLSRALSGQEINFSKSSVAFSRNTKEELCQHLTTELTIQRENKMSYA
ncbi:putative mitochondrial protein [Sesamum angolense]|uniref:Mitochondrial protein n=1 Tax=Sesamum angolense TaxID=2727404 RepID=A0AAE1WAZ9_9LAMI|nr:putative mitochondrial protein [Sesamum angolense]